MHESLAKDLGVFFFKKTRTVLLLLNIYGLIDIDNDAASYVVQCFSY